jgi:glutaredoxin
MKIVYFVKDGCDACKKAREKVEFFLARWGVSGGVDRESISLSTVDGLVEAAMREVHDIPTVVIEDGSAEVARWARRPPTAAELQAVLGLEAAAQDPAGVPPSGAHP